MTQKDETTSLLSALTYGQKLAVRSPARRVLVVAGAGSGKTEVMARRIAWWVGVEGVKREQIVAFTFTERAAEEMKFRIRGWMQKVREFWSNEYHTCDFLGLCGMEHAMVAKRRTMDG